MEDIHDLKGVLERNSEKYILQLFEEDQKDAQSQYNNSFNTTIAAMELHWNYNKSF
jgi:hypothetical protein